MAQAVGDTGGKSRSATQSGRKAIGAVEGYQPIRDQLFSQIAEALRTGGIGAGIPIIQESVSQARGAMSDSLAGTEGDLARSGLGRTPFGARVLAESKLGGEQNIAAIPTAYAQQFISGAPGLLGSVFQALAGVSSSHTRSGPYST